MSKLHMIDIPVSKLRYPEIVHVSSCFHGFLPKHIRGTRSGTASVVTCKSPLCSNCCSKPGPWSASGSPEKTPADPVFQVFQGRESCWNPQKNQQQDVSPEVFVAVRSLMQITVARFMDKMTSPFAAHGFTHTLRTYSILLCWAMKQACM